MGTPSRDLSEPAGHDDLQGSGSAQVEGRDRLGDEGLGSARGRGLGTAAVGSGSAGDPGPGSARVGRLKDLSARHHRAWADDDLSYQDIADELGVSRQAVRQAFLNRTWTKANAPSNLNGTAAAKDVRIGQSTPGAAAAPQMVPKAPPATPPGRDASDWLSDDKRRQLSAMIAQGTLDSIARVIRLVHSNLSKDTGQIGPSALSSYTRTLRNAVEIAAGLLHPPDDDDADVLTAFRVETMSDEDEARVKAEASANLRGISEAVQLPGPDQPVPTENRDEDKAPLAVQISPPIDDSTPLPGRAELRSWLLSRAKVHGRRHLRDIAEHVGLRPALQDTDAYLVDSIVHAIDGDPQRLRRPRS